LSTPTIGVVIIGRNEAERLTLAMESVRAANVADAVYVDSASSDGSVGIAEEMGFRVIRLRGGLMTAGRGREEGWRALDTDLVFFLDGDSALEPEFLNSVAGHFDDPRTACVFGSVRERRPERSFFHRMNERYLSSWSPFGDGGLRGGNHLWRTTALAEAGGFDSRLLTMENVELGARAREAGFRVLYLPASMAVHDLGPFGYSSFVHRARRVGFSVADCFLKIRRPLTWFLQLQDPRETVTQSFGIAASFGAALFLPSSDILPAPAYGAGVLLLMTLRSAWLVRARCVSSAEALLFGVHETLRAFGFLAGFLERTVLRNRSPPDWRR